MKLRRLHRYLLFTLLLALVQNGLSAKAFAFAFKTEEPKAEGFRIHLFQHPNGDKHEIFLKGKLIHTISKARTVSDVTGKIGERYEKYKKQLGIASDGMFLSKLKNHDQMFLFLAVYDRELGEAMGISATIDLDDVKDEIGSGNVQFTVKSYKGDKLIKTAKTNLTATGKFPKIIPVKNVTADPYDSSVEVKWDLIKGGDIIAYNIFTATNEKGPFKQYNDKPIVFFQQPRGKKLSTRGVFIVDKLENKKKYFFRMTSIHFNSMQSEFSKTVSAIPVDMKIPMPPNITEMKQSESGMQVELFWENPTKFEDIEFFQIFRSTSMDGKYQRVNKVPLPAAKQSFVDIGPFDFRKTYWYRMQSVNDDGLHGPLSAGFQYRPQKNLPPGKVRSLKVTKAAKGLKLSFTPNKEDGLDKLEVYRGVNSKSKFTKVKSIAKDAKEFTDLGVDARNSYCYSVRARDVVGNLSHHSNIVCEKPRNTLKLDPPANILAYQDQGGVVLEWKGETHSLLRGFVIYRRSGKGAFKEIKRITKPGQNLYIDKDKAYGELAYQIASLAADKVLGDKSRPVLLKRMAPLPQSISQVRIFRSGKKGFVLSWDYYTDFDTFEIEIVDQSKKAKKKIFLSKAKTYKWTPATAGNYAIGVRCIKSGRKSLIKKWQQLTVP